jgi:ATP-dependent RNA helicase RhlE
LTTFADLGLLPDLLRAVRDAAYTTPTPIQSQVIPVALRGGDVLGCAQTGTGKTASFLLPVLQRLTKNGRGAFRAVVLTPTRELAAQIGEAARTYGKYLRLHTAVIVGGVRLEPQTAQLRRGDLLVATPGRFLDHLRRGTVAVSSLAIVVLDEADRMLDMGFLPDVQRILRALPAERQTLLFSATMPPEIETLAHQTLRSPTVIDIGRRATPVATVRQVLHPVEAEQKRALLGHLLRQADMRHVLVFTRTKVRAERLARSLTETGRRVAVLHGGKRQGARVQVLDRFRRGEIDVLVATDLAARGLDVDGISHVVNFDVPSTPEDYVHRIGRTARADALGDAVSLVAADEIVYVRAIERLIGAPLPYRVVAGFDPGTAAVRRFAAPVAPRAARLASGAVRRFSPRRQRSRYSA